MAVSAQPTQNVLILDQLEDSDGVLGIDEAFDAFIDFDQDRSRSDSSLDDAHESGRILRPQDNVECITRDNSDGRDDAAAVKRYRAVSVPHTETTLNNHHLDHNPVERNNSDCLGAPSDYGCTSDVHPCSCPDRPANLDANPHPRLLSFHVGSSRSAADTRTRTRNRNEAGPQVLPRAMEGPGALAVSAAPQLSTSRLALDTWQKGNSDKMTVDQTNNATYTPAKDTGSNSSASWLDTPARVTDHGVLSNLRGDNDQQFPFDHLKNENLEEVFSNDALSFENPAVASEVSEPVSAFPVYEEPSTPSNAAVINGEQSTTADEAAEDEITTHEAYAMLKFADSYALITSLNLVITRDESYQRRWRHEEKERKKRMKEQQAQRALMIYAQEPSHKSEDEQDQDPSSRSGDGEHLEGRPARSLLSNYSEQGGPVAFAPPDDEGLEEVPTNRIRRRNRKNNANSSTSNSIAPADLHFDASKLLDMNTHVGEDGIVSDPQEWAALPVHTTDPEDIKKISREHLIFSYDAQNQRWVLHVVGNGAIVNEQHYPRGTRDLELHHDDEIFISTVGMRFALPPAEQAEAETILNSVESASNISTSSLRRPSNASESDEDDEEAETERQTARARKKPLTIKLSLKNVKKATAKGTGKDVEKVASKTGGKTKPKEKGDDKEEAKDLTKKSDKGKKAKPAMAEEDAAMKSEANKTTTAAESSEGTAPAKATQASPPVPVHLEPGSVLADLAPEQMPEKRKGPGRPPKNGLLSKRDESGVKRKQKEYQRRGLPLPELNQVLAEVRAEQKAKDAAAKAQARGEAAPDMPVPSIEMEVKVEGEGGSRSVPRESHGQEGETPMLTERRASSPKPPRRIKSPSPIKPESAFTEEELKKPNMTYIYIIDEILQNIEGGQADLQTIYDKIQKRWPYYKYKVGSVGWQSSVRHNLLSCERFKDAGKSGKGKMWTINPDHPLDNKKRRPSPPPRPPQMPMPNGQMPHGLHNMPYQYGQPGYPPPPYGHQQYNPKGPYASPYRGGPIPPSGPYQSSHLSSNQQPPANPFGNIVADIIAFRNIWLQAFPNDSAEYSRQENEFNRGMNHFSNLYHKQPSNEDVNGEEEPFKTLKAIFEQHSNVFSSGGSASAQADSQGAASAPSSTSNQPDGIESQNSARQHVGSTDAANSQLASVAQIPGSAPLQPGMHAQANVLSHSHGTVQQQVGNAVASQALPAATTQMSSTQASEAPAAPQANSVSGIQQAQAVARPNQNQGSGSDAQNATTVEVGQTSNSTSPQPPGAINSASANIDSASLIAGTQLASMSATQMEQLRSRYSAAGGAGTPKAPTPEALSRPSSAGAKRAADDSGSTDEEDHETKRQRTS